MYTWFDAGLSSSCHETCHSGLMVLHVMKDENSEIFSQNEGALKDKLAAISQITQVFK